MGPLLIAAMKNEFHILISFRTPEGFKVCGQYFLGQNSQFAQQVFAGLKGEVSEDKAMLHLDLIESTDGIPAQVKTVSCRLSELCANCEHITRELFRLYAIKPAKQSNQFLD